MHSITKREKITYTGSLLGQNMIYSLMTMYVMFFFTDLLRIPSQSVTIIMVAASLWDAVNDILMGMIADRTRTRIGKFRPCWQVPSLSALSPSCVLSALAARLRVLLLSPRSAMFSGG